MRAHVLDYKAGVGPRLVGVRLAVEDRRNKVLGTQEREFAIAAQAAGCGGEPFASPLKTARPFS